MIEPEIMKKYGGKTFVGFFKTKKQAQKGADWIRKSGFNARVTKESTKEFKKPYALWEVGKKKKEMLRGRK